MSDLEEKFYEIAAQELATKQVAVGLMAKAYSECDGDEKKASARYIKLRVEQLKQELYAQRKNEEAIKQALTKQAQHEERKRLREEVGKIIFAALIAVISAILFLYIASRF
jgi:Fe2+ transport system protein B